jgi:hypothetical protein
MDTRVDLKEVWCEAKAGKKSEATFSQDLLRFFFGYAGIELDVEPPGDDAEPAVWVLYELPTIVSIWRKFASL